MAKTLATNDAYTLMTEIVKQATGQKSIAVVDTTSFVSVGETLLRTGTEDVLNAISTVVARTIFSARPYRQKFDIMRTTPERWGAIVRKVVPLYMGYEESTDHNTVENSTTLADGNSVDMYKINNPKAIQLNFYGSTVLQKSITRYRDQLSKAFHDEREFMSFIDAIMVEFNNEVELANENKARLVVANYIAGKYATNDVVNLTAEFNDRYSTSYTTAQLLTTHITEFMKFFASVVKTYSSRLTDNTSLYHTNITGYNKILRHVPKDRQRMFMYAPLFIEAESEVYSGLFNPQYLNIGDFEGVNFWQNPNTPMEIIAKPTYLDATTGKATDSESAITIENVVGILFDVEAMGIMPQFDYASTTPFNSAGGYWNEFLHWRFNSYADYTENAVVFIMEDE